MRAFTLGCLLLAVGAFNMAGAGHEVQWQKVEDAVKKGLPKTAIQAIADGRDPAPRVVRGQCDADIRDVPAAAPQDPGRLGLDGRSIRVDPELRALDGFYKTGGVDGEELNHVISVAGHDERTEVLQPRSAVDPIARVEHEQIIRRDQGDPHG